MNKKFSAEAVKVAISQDVLLALFRAGGLNPSDLQCLDGASKEIVRKLCMHSCAKKSCAECSLQGLCATPVFSKPIVERVEIKFLSTEKH